MNHYKEILAIAMGREEIRRDWCVDERRVGSDIFTPAATLASEGERDAAEWLRTNHGANVNYIARGAAQGGHREYAKWLRTNHGANVNYIALGAAQGGHREYAEWLRTNHGANVNYIARGAAQGGHREYAEWLRTKHGANVNDIALGATLGGHREYAEWLRTKHGANMNDIAFGAALGGHREYAEWLRTNHGANVNNIASGAAQGGHREYAEWLRTKHGANVNYIARNAAHGGHREYAEWLRTKHGANVNDIALGAALGGHREYAEWLRTNHGANVNDIARGAALGGHREYAEWLRTNHGANVNDIARGATDDVGSPELALHYLTFIADDRFRRNLGRNLRFRHGARHITDRLIEKAGYIRTKMQQTKLSYQQVYDLVNQPGLQNWMHTSQSRLLDSRTAIPPEIHLHIASFFRRASFDDTSDLHQKAIFDRNKTFIVDKLTRETGLLFGSFSLAKDKTIYGRANTLKSNVLGCDNPTQIIRLLEQERDFLQEGYDHTKYSIFLAKHLKRFKEFDNPQQPVSEDLFQM